MGFSLEKTISGIDPVDRGLAAEGQARLDNLTKPKGSLGRLEELALQVFMIQQGKAPQVDPAKIFTVAGDHGVAAEGVSLFPREVTRQMVENFVFGGAGVNVLAKTAGVDLCVVDAGCAGGRFKENPVLVQAKVAPGTENFTKGPAMSREQCLEALALGVSLADKACDEGFRTIGTGDMGIGNTTPSTALYCAFLGLEPEDVTGPGTGLDREGVDRKVQVVRRALRANSTAVSAGDPLAVLAALGGLEIACLAGLILGAAGNRQVICVDGFISTAAFAAAWKMCPHVSDYAVLSHQSAEPGHAGAVQALGLKPVLDLSMRLGEGTGAALMVFMLRSAVNIFNQMASFADAGVSKA